MWHLHQTQYRVWVDTYFCLCPLEHLIMGQYWPRPRRRCTINRIHNQTLFRTPISVWYWTNSEFPRSLCSCILPNSMYNLVPDGWWLSLTKTWTIPIYCFHCECWVTCCDSNLFSTYWKTFVMYWWFVIFMFWKSVFVFTSRTSFLVPVELEDSSLSSCFQELAFWVFSCRFTWEYRIGSWLGFRISFLMLREPPCSFSTFPDGRDCSNLAEGSSSHSKGCATPNSWVLTSPEFTGSLTWHSASWSDPKENYWNGCKRKSRNS